MLAINWPDSGIGWVVFGVVVIVVVVLLVYMHVRDERVSSIRFGFFLERAREDVPPVDPDEDVEITRVKWPESDDDER